MTTNNQSCVHVNDLMNTVIISTYEYKQLITDAQRAKQKEKDLTNSISAEKDQYYEMKYREEIETLRTELQMARREKEEYRRMYLDLMYKKIENKKVKEPTKSHWWSFK